MTTLEIQVPDIQAQKYKVLFQSLAKKSMTNEDFEDVLLSIKIDEVVSHNASDYIDASHFLKTLGKSISK